MILILSQELRTALRNTRDLTIPLPSIDRRAMFELPEMPLILAELSGDSSMYVPGPSGSKVFFTRIGIPFCDDRLDGRRVDDLGSEVIVRELPCRRYARWSLLQEQCADRPSSFRRRLSRFQACGLRCRLQEGRRCSRILPAESGRASLHIRCNESGHYQQLDCVDPVEARCCG